MSFTPEEEAEALKLIEDETAARKSSTAWLYAAELSPKWKVALEALREKVAAKKPKPWICVECNKEIAAGTLARNMGNGLAHKECEKPKRPTLEEMEAQVVEAANSWSMEHIAHKALIAAADVLKALREDTIPQLRAAFSGFGQEAWCVKWASDRLRAIGELP